MPTFLFNDIIFGPVWSRRLGESLGINLLPAGRKVCNFNCVYCECGLTPEPNADHYFPDPEVVIKSLNNKLQNLRNNAEYLNSITFAGNGEPTLHPRFPQIITRTIESRDKYYPEAKIAVLSNATLIVNKEIFEALLLADLNILKLDSAIEETLKLINCPRGNFNIHEIVDRMQQFRGKIIIQTLFLRGSFNGIAIDNTSEKEVSSWIHEIKKIKPEHVMLYSIARDTAVTSLERVDEDQLRIIARRVEEAGFNAQVTP